MNNFERIKAAIEQIGQIEEPLIFVINDTDLDKLRETVPDFDWKYDHHFKGSKYMEKGAKPFPLQNSPLLRMANIMASIPEPQFPSGGYFNCRCIPPSMVSPHSFAEPIPVRMSFADMHLVNSAESDFTSIMGMLKIPKGMIGRKINKSFKMVRKIIRDKRFARPVVYYKKEFTK